MNVAIKNWQDFLDSLATSGGNIVTLGCCSIGCGFLWVWVLRHGLTNMVTPTFGVFTGFTGALLQAQKGNSSRQQMADRVETALGGSKVQVDSASTVNVENNKTTVSPSAIPTAAQAARDALKGK